MKLKVIVHQAAEGGFWAEVPALPGCCTQGETIEELLEHVHEAVECCLSADEGSLPGDQDSPPADEDSPPAEEGDQILEITL